MPAGVEPSRAGKASYASKPAVHNHSWRPVEVSATPCTPFGKATCVCTSPEASAKAVHRPRTERSTRTTGLSTALLPPRQVNVAAPKRCRSLGWVSNAVDNPVVRVERQVDRRWTPFADATGEVQTQVAFPQGVQGVADTTTGRQEWLWTAGFEAYDAFPARLGSTPSGTYRFVVDGVSRTTGVDAPYALTSAPFRVTPWTGVQVTDGRVDGGDVSFRVPDSRYPRSYASAFRTIRDDKNSDGRSAFCRTCSFRPWAQTASAAAAVVTVTRADGEVQQVDARLVDGRWVADTDLSPGDSAVVAAGAVRDAYGETNADALTVR